MFVVAVHITIHRDHVDAFRARVLQQASDSKTNEAACKQFDVSTNPDEPTKFFLYEVYDDADAFAQHRTTAYFHDFTETVTPMIESKQLNTLERIS